MRLPTESDFGRQRREVLRRLAIAAAAGFVPSVPGAAAASPPTTRTIPASGEMLPVIGLGTYQTFDVGADPGRRGPLGQVLRRFVDLGGKVIDSSPMYGQSETVVGDLVAELRLRSGLFIATKVWTTGRGAGARQMEESLQKLRAGRLDLMQVHNLLDLSAHLPTLRDWRAAGRIRYLGVTHYHSSAYPELERHVRSRVFDFVQLNYSLVEPEAEERLLPTAMEAGVGVLVNRPFAQGELFRQVRGKALPPWAADYECSSWAQFFLKWIVSHPAVTCAIPATADPRHLEDNMGAVRGRLPDAAGRTRMAEYVRRL